MHLRWGLDSKRLSKGILGLWTEKRGKHTGLWGKGKGEGGGLDEIAEKKEEKGKVLKGK